MTPVLKESIEQIKTALFILMGDFLSYLQEKVGLVKSYLVNIIYQYCLEYDLLAENAPHHIELCAICG